MQYWDLWHTAHTHPQMHCKECTWAISRSKTCLQLWLNACVLRSLILLYKPLSFCCNSEQVIHNPQVLWKHTCNISPAPCVFESEWWTVSAAHQSTVISVYRTVWWFVFFFSSLLVYAYRFVGCFCQFAYCKYVWADERVFTIRKVHDVYWDF